MDVCAVRVLLVIFITSKTKTRPRHVRLNTVTVSELGITVFRWPPNFEPSCGICPLWNFYVSTEFCGIRYWPVFTFIFQFKSKFAKPLLKLTDYFSNQHSFTATEKDISHLRYDQWLLNIWYTDWQTFSYFKFYEKSRLYVINRMPQK